MNMTQTRIRITQFGLVGLFALTAVGCGSTPTEQAASTGAVVGGIVDGWGGAAVGAVIGAGIGYASESAEAKKQSAEAKKIQAELQARQVAALEKASITDKPDTAYRPANSNPLTGSTWRLVSLADDSGTSPTISSMVISFPTNAKATTLVLYADGRSETFSEDYSVTGDVLVFYGKDYVTNARYTVSDKNMVMVAEDVRAVFEEIEESI